jgi:gamma-glutamyl-gamma-aminobutyrate hydrolase PuuD
MTVISSYEHQGVTELSDLLQVFYSTADGVVKLEKLAKGTFVV